MGCAACVCAFEEALVGEEFGGVEGADVGEGLVELWVFGLVVLLRKVEEGEVE